ncbi:hypothetical protein CFP65_4549 [Kitasatospora sp. MMS16-BH015]|uniref:hypothetical protein n=1 Tax=Kitasatospora sp. MMS16-BH015 TaxID=2018025 RepID=UPI000CA0F1DF|nr:hypothetical protein [Kitasatospora sp. MMS16-BH015]AUG79294.1 hypothetical protein CFP65_4549 [Kitasatospora sp. MMS16-BH015]
MAIDLPRLTEAARDPDKYIPQLEEMQEEAKKNLRGISGALRELRKIKTSTENLEYIQVHGIPRPRDSGQQADPDEYDEVDEELSENGLRVNRRERVLKLLAQDRDRRWKLREIADELGISNIKSLRTSMDDFARQSKVEKDSESSTYYLGRRGYQETF